MSKAHIPTLTLCPLQQRAHALCAFGSENGQPKTENGCVAFWFLFFKGYVLQGLP